MYKENFLNSELMHGKCWGLSAQRVKVFFLQSKVLELPAYTFNMQFLKIYENNPSP